MRKFYLLVNCLVATLLLSGCSVRVASKKVESTNLAQGHVYKLPVTKLKINLTAKLTSCKKSPVIEIINASATRETLGGNQENEVFYIDTRELKSGNKEIPSLKIKTNSQGILTSVSYKVNDKTDKAIEGVAKVVAVASGIPIPTQSLINMSNKQAKSQLFSIPPQNFLQDTLSCSQNTLTTLNKRNELNNTIENLRKSIFKINNPKDDNKNFLNKLQKLYNQEILKLPTNENQADAIKKINLLQNALTGETNRLEKEKKERQSTLQELLKEYDLLEQKLQKSISVEWIPRDINNNTQSLFDFAKLNEWFNNTNIENSNLLKEWKKENTMTFSTNCKEVKEIKELKGNLLNTALYYRVPKQCNINISTKTKNIVLKDIPLFQFGYLASFNLENKVFQNTDYTVTFNNDGTIQEYEFKSPNAPLETGIASIANAYNIIDKSEAEKLKEEKDIINAKKLLIEAEKNLILEEIEKLKKEKDLKNLLNNENSSVN